MSKLQVIKNWLMWKIAGKTIDKFISVNCQTIIEEFPDLEYIKFRFREKDYEFKRS